MDKTIEKLQKEAFKEIERQAREIMAKHKYCVSFCMGMGSACFYDNDNSPIDSYHGDELHKYIRDFYAFINDIDNLIGILGDPMRIWAYDALLETDW